MSCTWRLMKIEPARAHRQSTDWKKRFASLRDGLWKSYHIKPLGRHIATPDTVPAR